MTKRSRRPLNHSLVRALRRVPDFSALDDGILLKVVGASVNLFWPGGATVFEQGSSSEALYILLGGRVRIADGSVEADDLAQISPGDYFGELSLLSNSMHTKSAQAIEDSEIMVLPKSSFEALLRTDEELAEQVRGKRAGYVEEARLS
ncbi:MAG: cyclic nucleotide-binding domain-containing protein [Actinomycetota bacterium]